MGEAASEAAPDLAEAVNKCQSDYSENGPPNICEFATRALGRIGPPAKNVVPTLESFLGHGNPYFRAYLSIALIRIDPANQKGVRTLGQLLKHPEADVRRKTIWELKDIGAQAKPAEAAIKDALRDSDSEVRAAASRLMLILNNKVPSP